MEEEEEVLGGFNKKPNQKRIFIDGWVYGVDCSREGICQEKIFFLKICL